MPSRELYVALSRRSEHAYTIQPAATKLDGPTALLITGVANPCESRGWETIACALEEAANQFCSYESLNCTLTFVKELERSY